ncbi:hypothetical protein M0813_25634 [Anaeramoeba flamelloides]|uniref:PH domain-containing protein n=1 Tax=Anaeramoeba flamelloides TaxID=1746091 RepID=A0ABQ8Y2H4_9EUKA|nr:hypothetical protein M0813_25634 [Anaeramoeba flamelloides]
MSNDPILSAELCVLMRKQKMVTKKSAWSQRLVTLNPTNITINLGKKNEVLELLDLEAIVQPKIEKPTPRYFLKLSKYGKRPVFLEFATENKQNVWKEKISACVSEFV